MKSKGLSQPEVMLIVRLRQLREGVSNQQAVSELLPLLDALIEDYAVEQEQSTVRRKENQLLREALGESEVKLHEKIEEISLLRLIADMETLMIGAQDPFETILSQVVNLTGAENGSIMIHDQTTGTVMLKCAGGIRKHFRSKPLSFKLGQGIAGRVVQEGKAMLIGDVLDEPSFEPMDARGPMVRSLFCLPLKVDKEVLGVINISHSLPFAFTLNTHRVMHIISQYLAMALRSADLLERQRNYLRMIEASETRYRTLVESVNDGFFILDAHGCARLVNQQFCRIVGYTREEILAMESWRPLVLPSDWERVSGIFQEYALPGSDLEHSFEFMMCARDNREVPVHVRCRLARMESGPCCVGVVRDMTEYRALQSQLLHSEKLASLGTLLTGITHELNNKLTPILGYSQLLQQEGRVPDKVMTHVKAIESCATGAKAIVDSLLGFTRRSSLSREPVRIGELVHEVLLLVRPTLDHCNIRVDLFLEGAQSQTVGSPHQLEQVLLNIINNAIQAMEPQGGGILTITSGSSLDVVWVSIADSGPGIPDEILPHIFDPFFTTKAERKGTGLGLSVSYGIIKAHGGELRVQTAPGQGARFIVELPIMDAVDEQPVTHKQPTPSAKQRRRILVVDDEELIGEVIAEMLSDHDVRVVHDGRAAQLVLEKNDFDIMLLDMRMPFVDGPGLYRWICSRDPSQASRVIFTTGDTYDPETERFLSSVGRFCLSKPFTVDELRSAVAEHLERLI